MFPALLGRVLTDRTGPLRSQAAAAILLLYAQPVSQITWLTIDDIIRDGDQVLLRLGDPPSPAPEPVADLLTTGSDFVINGLFLVFVVVAAGHGASPAEVGLMLALGGAGGMLGALAAPALARRITSTRLVVAGAVRVGVPLIALASLTTRPVLLGALLGLVLSVWPLYNAVVTARWMAKVPDALMGRVQSAVALLGWAPVPLAPWIGGLLTEHVGGAATVLTFAVLMLAIAVAATVIRHDDPVDRRHIELARTLKDLGMWRGWTAAEQMPVAAGGWPFKLRGDEPGETWFFIDSEEMAEGFAPRELAALALALRAYGIELRVDVVARPVHVEDGDHDGLALLLDPRIVAAVEVRGLPRRPG